MNNLFLKSYSAEDIILNNYNLKHFTNLFWKDVVNNLDPYKKAKVIMLAKYDKGYLALSKFMLVDKYSKDHYVNLIKSLLDHKSDYYTDSVITAIDFKYFIVESSELINDSYYNKFKSVDYTTIRITDIKPVKLPNNMDYKLWGNVIF